MKHTTIKHQTKDDMYTAQHVKQMAYVRGQYYDW